MWPFEDSALVGRIIELNARSDNAWRVPVVMINNEKDKEIERLKAEIATLTAEVEALRAYKAAVEANA